MFLFLKFSINANVLDSYKCKLLKMVVITINKIHSKVVKLIKALNQYGLNYIVGKKQFYSPKMGKVLSIVQLRKIMFIDEYKIYKPDYKGKKEIFDVVLMESFREVEVLLKLVDIYSEVSNEGVNAKTETICT